MIDINELRQSLGAIQTEEVAELLDRLEAAESDALEQARLNGAGSEREAALVVKLEAAEKERDALRANAQDTSVRKAWARFSNELHRSPNAPYPGMADAFERHFSQSFNDREWRAESATWAAAWKAAKRHEAQPAPSVPEGWPTDEMTTAFAAVFNVRDQQATFAPAFRAALAAAPEAKL